MIASELLELSLQRARAILKKMAKEEIIIAEWAKKVFYEKTFLLDNLYTSK